MSATVITGKSAPYGRPVSGFGDDGPVVPRQPPRRFVLTTKKRSVSNALPGPIMPSHQPRLRPRSCVALLGGEAVARARGRGRGRVACRVRVAGQRMTHEDHVVARGRERAVGFVGDADGVELAAAVERERARQVEELGFDRANGPYGVVIRSRGHAPEYTAARA